MARLIDADRLLRDPYFQKDRWPESHLIRMAVREQRTVDTAPVVHGRWKKSNYHGLLCCSECKDVYIDKTWFGGGKWNYCPNCGAKMDGVSDG